MASRANQPAGVLQPLQKRPDPGLKFRVIGNRWQEHGNAPHALTLLCVRVERPRHGDAAEQRDEFATFQLIELHSMPASQAGLQNIELAAVSQEVLGRFYNLPLFANSARCPSRVKVRSHGTRWHGRSTLNSGHIWSLPGPPLSADFVAEVAEEETAVGAELEA